MLGILNSTVLSMYGAIWFDNFLKNYCINKKHLYLENSKKQMCNLLIFPVLIIFSDDVQFIVVILREMIELSHIFSSSVWFKITIRFLGRFFHLDLLIVPTTLYTHYILLLVDHNALFHFNNFSILRSTTRCTF